MSETETLSGRLRGVAEKFAVIHEERNRENTDVMVDEEVIFNACCRLDEAADALDAKDALLREAGDVIGRLLQPNAPFSASAIEENGAVAGHARALLLKLTEATK